MDVFSFPHYMALHGTILVFGVVFLLWRKPGRGIRLRLKGGFKPKHQALPNNNPVPFRAATGLRPHVLNVHFMHNGHSFDAYEIMGIPAGSGWDRIESAYRAQLTVPNGHGREFLDAAMKALRDHLRAS